MVKMAASLLLILGGAGIGYARSREITEREKNLEILLQILFFLKGEIRCGNSSLPDAFREIAAKISGPFEMILRDAAQEMEDTGGKNLEEIMESCIQRNFYQGNPGGSQRKEEMEILRTLGRRLGYLDREMQIKQIEFLWFLFRNIFLKIDIMIAHVFPVGKTQILFFHTKFHVPGIFSGAFSEASSPSWQ